MINVLDTKITDEGDIWFKVKLGRNTDILVRELYIEDEVLRLNDEAIFKFLKWQFEQYQGSK